MIDPTFLDDIEWHGRMIIYALGRGGDAMASERAIQDVVFACSHLLPDLFKGRCDFHPYRDGPLSPMLSEDLCILKDAGIISSRSRPRLSPEGIALYHEVQERIREPLEPVYNGCIDKFAGTSARRRAAYMLEMYPEYFDREVPSDDR